MKGGWLLSLIAKEVGLLFFFMKGEWSFFSLNVKVHSDSLTPYETFSKKLLWPTVLTSWHLS